MAIGSDVISFLLFYLVFLAFVFYIEVQPDFVKYMIRSSGESSNIISGYNPNVQISGWEVVKLMFNVNTAYGWINLFLLLPLLIVGVVIIATLFIG